MKKKHRNAGNNGTIKRCLCGALGAWMILAIAAAAATALPEATAAKLPAWRGVNLLGLFTKGGHDQGYREEDFRILEDLGFNFARLPVDYRTYIADGDWTKFREDVLKKIDAAVEWGGAHGVHVCLNLHRAPGYTVARPPEALSLWKDAEALRVCALHWGMFAKRYKGIPNARLSFNLLNEPDGRVDGPTYARVVKALAEAIRREDPGRLIICDGLSWGTKPCFELAPLGVAQATRGYSPMEVSHYRASWVGGSDRWPEPEWPVARIPAHLYGSYKPDLRSPLVVTGVFGRAASLRLRVDRVSSLARLTVRADGVEILAHEFRPGPGTGEWKRVERRPQWNDYEGVYDRDYTARVPAGTRRVEVRVDEGDWLTLKELGLRPEGGAEQALRAGAGGWGAKAPVLGWADVGGQAVLAGAEGQDRAWLRREYLEPWKKLQAVGVGVAVGEFGAFNRTPHEVVMRWMADCVANWREAGWGYAIWNLDGSFGFLDSGRADVKYEDWRGRKLDRQMLDVLLAPAAGGGR